MHPEARNEVVTRSIVIHVTRLIDYIQACVLHELEPDPPQ